MTKGLQVAGRPLHAVADLELAAGVAQLACELVAVAQHRDTVASGGEQEKKVNDIERKQKCKPVCSRFDVKFRHAAPSVSLAQEASVLPMVLWRWSSVCSIAISLLALVKFFIATFNMACVSLSLALKDPSMVLWR